MSFIVANDNEKPILRLEKGMPHFQIDDGLMIANRATIELSKDCPGRYQDMIMHAYNQGWIKPVAYMYEHELMMTALKG